MQPHRFFQMMQESFTIVINRFTVVRRKFELPVSPHSQLSVPPYRGMPRRQLRYSLIDRSRTRHILERKKIGDRLEIHLSLVPIDGQQALQFRSEIEIA